MSNQQHQEVPAGETVAPHENVMLLSTSTGDIALFGHEYVSDRLLQLIGTILSHDAFEKVYHGVKIINFRTDGFPKENGKQICASFSPDVCGISINLEKTLEEAINRSMDNPETSLLTSWWIEMILNICHECHHAVRWYTEKYKLDNDDARLAEEEELAEKYSGSMIITLAQEINMEPPNIEDETWFHSQILELLGGKGADAWAEAQREMMDKKIMWKHTPEDATASITIYTFKDVLCMIDGGNPESPEWNSPALDEQLNGKKMTVTAGGEKQAMEEAAYALTEKGQETLKKLTMEESTPTAPATTVTEEPYHGCEMEGMDEFEEASGEDDTAFTNYEEPAAPTSAPATPLTTPLPATTSPEVEEAGKAEVAEGQVDMSVEEINAIVKNVYMKMYEMFFTECGLINDPEKQFFGFTRPEAVCEIPIQLTPEEQLIFTTINHTDINGRWCQGVSTKGGLFGKVMKDAQIPAYEVFLNINGALNKRLIMPQNPNKRWTNGELSPRAVEARANNCIAYSMNPNVEGQDKWGPSIYNGEYRIPRRNQ